MYIETEEEKARNDAMWDEVYKSMVSHNEIVDAKNKRLFRAIKSVKGKAFLKNMLALFEECECSDHMGFSNQFELTRDIGKATFVSESYGRGIKGYFCQQWAVGCEGDSWSGYIYVKLKENLYIKSHFSM